jgi:hypothetical protein
MECSTENPSVAILAASWHIIFAGHAAILASHATSALLHISIPHVLLTPLLSITPVSTTLLLFAELTALIVSLIMLYISVLFAIKQLFLVTDSVFLVKPVVGFAVIPIYYCVWSVQQDTTSIKLEDALNARQKNT